MLEEPLDLNIYSPINDMINGIVEGDYLEYSILTVKDPRYTIASICCHSTHFIDHIGILRLVLVDGKAI